MNPTVVSSVAWSLSRTWGGRLAGFVIYFQLVRLLSPVEMGLFSAAFAVFVFLEILADQGLVQAVVQRSQISQGQLSAVLMVNVIAGMLLAAAVFLSAARLEAMIGIPQLAPVLQAGCLTLVFSSAGFAQEGMARRAFQFRRLALRTMISTIVGGAVGVGLAVAGHGVWALVAQMLVSAAVNTVVLWCRPAWNPVMRPDFRGIGGMTRFGAQVTAIRLIEFGATRGVELLIGALLGVTALGVYAVGTKLHYIFLQLLGLALSDVAQSRFARLAGDAARLRGAYLSAVGAVAMASTPVWLLLSAAAPEVASLAFGSRWAESAQVLSPFALLGALQVLQKFDTAALNAAGRPSLSILSSAARALAALLAVGVMHQEGMALLTLAIVASQLLVTPLNLHLLRRALTVTWRDWLLQLWRPLLAGGLALGAMHGCRSIAGFADAAPLLRLFMLGCAGGGIYLLVLIVVARGHLQSMLFAMRAARKS